MTHMEPGLESNVNTLERSYANHLRDKVGYTGWIETSRLDRPSLELALAQVQKAMYLVELARTHRHLGLELAPQHEDRIGTYTARLSQSREAASELIKQLDQLPRSCEGMGGEELEHLEGLCESLTRDVRCMAWAIRTGRTIRERIQEYSQTQKRSKPDMYDSAERLLHAMGIADLETVGVLNHVDRIVDLNRLGEILESARYLSKRLAKQDRRPCEGACAAR